MLAFSATAATATATQQTATKLSKLKPSPAPSPTPAANLDGDDLNDDWVPRNGAGKQKSCGVIRGEIQRFLATQTMTQTEFLRQIACNSNSFGRYMKLKGADNGYQNGVYWGAARFFEIQKRRAAAEKKANPGAAKRKREASATTTQNKKATGEELLARVAAIDSVVLDPTAPVFDTCNEVKKKITEFLKEGSVTKGRFCREIGVQGTQLDAFLKTAKGGAAWVSAHSQPGGANQTYWKAYRFFEQKRVLEAKKKSKSRQNNEATIAPAGFQLRHDNGKRWVFTGSRA